MQQKESPSYTLSNISNFVSENFDTVNTLEKKSCMQFTFKAYVSKMYRQVQNTYI